VNMRQGDIPENSRVFVIATSGVTKNDIRTAFEPFGTVEDVWFPKTQRQTNEATSNNGIFVSPLRNMQGAVHLICIIASLLEFAIVRRKFYPFVSN